ncbi:MAG: copper homeostasis protein CutC [Muribaculaceae bacterium]|nr:copper homeostasis protein CutC [Muribaculaceae bacterium]
MRKLEICCADINSVIAAKQGGAQRVELCTGLEEGGTTPSPALVEAAVATGMPVHVLIRPRGGDFVYSSLEKQIMLRDVEMAVRMGVKAVVVGALEANGCIDTGFLCDAVQAAGNAQVTFHRAFDRCAAPAEALEVLIENGVDYLLTSGCAPSAMQGAALLKSLVNQSNGRIEIIAAAGIKSSNLAQLISLTGCRHYHASARIVIPPVSPDPLFPPFFPADKNEVERLARLLK